jgi:hypothetical protein
MTSWASSVSMGKSTFTGWVDGSQRMARSSSAGDGKTKKTVATPSR